MSWNSIYNTEDELVKDLMGIDLQDSEGEHLKGFVFLSSFQATVNGGSELSPKQMTQLKRLYREVVKYHQYVNKKYLNVMLF